MLLWRLLLRLFVGTLLLVGFLGLLSKVHKVIFLKVSGEGLELGFFVIGDVENEELETLGLIIGLIELDPKVEKILLLIVEVHEHHWHALEVDIDASLGTGGVAVIVEVRAAIGQVTSDGDASTVLDDTSEMDAAGVGLG